MEFLAESDLKGSIGTTTLAQLKGADSENIATSEQLAISELAPLRGKYNIDAELAKTSTDRNKELLRMMVAITIYYLYNTVVDQEIPQRVVDNFDREVKNIKAISTGNQYTTIEAITETDGTTRTNFRYGGDDPRSHDPFF